MSLEADEEEFLSVLEELDSNETMANIDSPSAEHSECLKTKFGHNSFRPMQWKIINSIITNKTDNCVIMSTGYGKSLCFQYPAVYCNGLTMVISPLISLMEDQVFALSIANISACLLGTAQTDRNAEQDVLDGKYQIVYASPEYITNHPEYLEKLQKKLILIAIDEAHCVSQWGHDFRPSYRNLGILRTKLPTTPILAVTATATERVRHDICKLLNLRQPNILCTGFDRPNLEFIVRQRGASCWMDLAAILDETAIDGSVIIYCLTRKNTESIATDLQNHKVNCSAYHAGLSLKQRKQILEDFLRDRVKIIVATVAFGMGIDKPDVRYVIHYGAAKDIESYYQEVGRAGRDGQHSKCIMFYDRADFNLHSRLRDMSMMDDVVKDNLVKLSKIMQDYTYTTHTCRRLKILQYFEGDTVTCTPRSDCCDNCRRGSSSVELSNIYKNLDDEGLYDFTQDARLLIEALQLFNGWSGYAKPISLLRGSQSQTIKKYIDNPLHGKGRFKSEDYWQALADQLERLSFFEKKSLRNVQQKAFGHTIKVTSKAEHWLHSNDTLKLKPTDQMFKFLPKKHAAPELKETSSKLLPTIESSSSIKTEQQSIAELKDSLTLIRAALATQYDTMSYVIASNLALEQIATIQPLNLDDMRSAKIDGFSDAKIQKFGQKFITAILKWKRFLSADTNDLNSMEAQLQLNQYPDNRVTLTHERIRYLLARNKSIDEISAELSVKSSTIIQYISILIKAGVPYTKADIRKFMKIDEDTQKHIESKLPKDPNEIMSIRLKTIKENCDPTIEYDPIKLLLSYHQVRAYLNQQNMKFLDPDDVKNVDIVPNKNEDEQSTNKMELDDEQTSNPLNEWDDDDSCFGQIDGKDLEILPIEPMSIVDKPIETNLETTASQLPQSKVIHDSAIDSMFDKDDDEALGNLELIEIKPTEKHPLAMEIEHEPVVKEQEKNIPRNFIAKSNPNKRVMYGSDDDDDDDEEDDQLNKNDNEAEVKKPQPKTSRSQMPQWVHDAVQRPKLWTAPKKNKNLF